MTYIRDGKFQISKSVFKAIHCGALSVKTACNSPKPLSFGLIVLLKLRMSHITLHSGECIMLLQMQSVL